MRSTYNDRFIPRRTKNKTIDNHMKEPTTTIYSTIMDIGEINDQKVLSFNDQPNQPNTISQFIVKSLRKKRNYKENFINPLPILILDAPEATNNFYYNPLDFSESMVGVGLRNLLYTYSDDDENVCYVERIHDSDITCVKFNDQQNRILSIGTSKGFLQFFDLQLSKAFREIKHTVNRVGAITYLSSVQLLSGRKNSQILKHDLRQKKSVVQIFNVPKGEVCSLAATQNYFASGGTDNGVYIWDFRYNKLLYHMNQHNGAVKALKWCPWKQNLLISGGGLYDDKLIFWNTHFTKPQQIINTGSQITGLVCQKKDKMIITSHGKINDNIILWDYQTCKSIKSLTGHAGRVICMSGKPKDNEILCSLGSDQTLKFWDIRIQNNRQAKLNIKQETKQDFKIR